MNIVGLIQHHITIVLPGEFINYSVRVCKLINMVFSNKINNIGRECAACSLIFFNLCSQFYHITGQYTST